MEVPYRCPSCHALLKRSTELAELLKDLPDERNTYTCGVCGHVMKGSDVQGGKFDVATELPDTDGETDL